MRIIYLFISLFLILACKENNNANRKELTSIVDSNKLIKKDLEYKNDSSLIDDKNILKLPIKGGDYLMMNEEEVELQELKHEANEIMSELCNSDYVSYYQLPKKNELSPIIIEDECGDNTYYILAIYSKNKLIDNISIFSYWTDMEEGNSNEKITDFYISKDYNIKISNIELQGKKKIKESFNNFIINDSGKIIKINKNIFTKGSIVNPTVQTYLNVRETPNSSSSIVTKAYPKDALKVVEVLDGWLKISFNGTEGYVSSEFVK